MANFKGHDPIVVDSATGEILTGYSVIAAETIEQRRKYAERDAARRQLGRSHSFTNTDMDTLNAIFEHFTLHQSGYLFVLQSYIGWENGLLTGTNNEALTYSKILDALQLPKSTFAEFMDACLRSGVVTESDGKYFVNTRYHFKGRFNKRAVVKSYSTAVKRSLSENRAADLGILYRLLPYVSMEYNALCHNPYEKDPKEIRWLTQKEIAQKVGIDTSTFRRRVPRMKIDGENVFLAHRTGGGKTRYSVNPKLVSRGDYSKDDRFVSLFEKGK